MPFETYLAYLAVIAVFFGSPPGPSQVLMISNSARHGLRRSVFTVWGDLTANALQMTAAAFGLAALIAASDVAIDLIKWAGVAYLIWMGIRCFRGRAHAGPGRTDATSARSLWTQGFVTSASNPKAVVFFAALFPQFIDPASPILPQLLILGVTYLVVDGIILCIYGGLAERALRALARTPRLLNRVSGSLMIVAAILLGMRDLDMRDTR